MITELINRVLEEIAELDDQSPVFEPAELVQDEIPTLEPGYHRPMSPQMQERFALFGAWPEATHGDWLSLTQMRNLWSLTENNVTSHQRNLTVINENWPNDATVLFKMNRISIFALSGENTERIYLMWFDCIDEPEIWVYDTNGEAHYRDFKAYLQAYLDDDLTAFQRHWILGNNSIK